ncbi:sugar transferase [Segetibacter aerophilus]|uniref:Undecaprenyl-phosphate glucose phosphotransferase n=1 Tax=Segetibacter aerophilus TaxID=670293 RepID=A0A512BI42_9BACT|nr:sugar transferase [Segetibacter aerophilus]GEO11620.1 undecaprenyl-phosphate glucose phosphotransferase [Segetibacter aerophilus]
MSQRYSKYSPAIVLILDLLILNPTLLINFSIISNDEIRSTLFYQLFFTYNISWILIAFSTSNMHFARPINYWGSLQKIITSSLIHLVVVLGTLYLLKQYHLGRLFFATQFVSFSLILLVQRIAIIYGVSYLRVKGYNRRKIWLLGDTEVVQRVERSFSNHPEYGYNLIKPLPRDLSEYSKQEIKSFITFNEIDELFICFKEIKREFINDVLEYEKMGLKIKMISDLQIDSANTQLLSYHNFPVIHISSSPFEDQKAKLTKRAFDLVVSSFIMICGLPIFLLLVLITKITTKGRVFYMQERIGKNGVPFYIFKFRTMHLNAESNGPQLAKENDPRVTSWGRIMRRTRLDELPQFLNVFIGQMSVVGPRPERRFFIEQIIQKAPEYKNLLSIKPGITSIGQIKYGYAENIDQMIQRMKFDQVYLKNQKLTVDLNIIMATVRFIIEGKAK